MSNFVNLMDIVYPIGSIYQSMSVTSPASTIGGTWTKINTFLYGADTVGQTGGERTHTLTIVEMPTHAHAQYVTANTGGPAVRCDYASDAHGLLYPQGINTGDSGGGGTTTQQLAALHNLFHLVSHSIAALKASCLNLSEVAYA